MIISASYRTDIPAFYGDWFMHRLDAGYCLVENPYSGKPYQVNLTRADVAGFVFWTKNLGPFIDRLIDVHDRGFPFVVQYTINSYPRALEFSVVDADRSVEHMQRLAETYGSRVAVWRYDTVVYSSLTPPDFHRANFERLARALAGTTDEVVISFAQIYQKTRRNMDWAGRKFDFTWEDPSDTVKRELANDFLQIATAYGMRLTVCGQREFVAEEIGDAACIDARRLSDVAGRAIEAGTKGHRPDCGCVASRDIGAYDTCPHGCVYCYAVRNRPLAQRRYKAHDPAGEFLYAPARAGQVILETSDPVQPKLL